MFSSADQYILFMLRIEKFLNIIYKFLNSLIFLKNSPNIFSLKIIPHIRTEICCPRYFLWRVVTSAEAPCVTHVLHTELRSAPSADDSVIWEFSFLIMIKDLPKISPKDKCTII